MRSRKFVGEYRYRGMEKSSVREGDLIWQVHVCGELVSLAPREI